MIWRWWHTSLVSTNHFFIRTFFRRS